MTINPKELLLYNRCDCGCVWTAIHAQPRCPECGGQVEDGRWLSTQGLTILAHGNDLRSQRFPWTCSACMETQMSSFEDMLPEVCADCESERIRDGR